MRSFIVRASVASAHNFISGPVPRSSYLKLPNSLQLHTSCLSDVSLDPKLPGVSVHTVISRNFRILGLTVGETNPEMCGVPRARASSLTNAVKHMSSRPRLPIELEPISLSEKEKITLVKAEYELYKAEGEIEIPSKMEEKEYETLALLPDDSTRRNHLKYLYLKEMRAIDRAREKAVKAIQNEEQYVRVTEELKSYEGQLAYGLWRNSMFINYSTPRMNNLYAQRVFHAKAFGQPIVFDYGFDTAMYTLEKGTLGKQMAKCIGLNRMNIEPYYMHICNFKKDEEVARETLRRVPTLLQDDYPADTHEEDIVDLFPREKLVYITPHCRDELLEYDHDAIYVIGGLINFKFRENFILGKAKKQKIRMQKLPIDRYLNWGTTRKSLPLDELIGILLEVKRSGDWVKAFDKFIPKNRLAQNDGPDVDILRKTRRNKIRLLQRLPFFDE